MNDQRQAIRWSVCIAALSVVLFVVDRILKWTALTQWTDRHVVLLPGVQLEFLLNRGIALSLPVTGTLAIVLIVLLAGILVVLFFRSIMQKDWIRASIFFLVLCGATSNVIDRFLYGGVIDYFHAFFPSVINLADVMIVVGVVALVLPREQKSAVQE